jgi:hypothetical protein
VGPKTGVSTNLIWPGAGKSPWVSPAGRRGLTNASCSHPAFHSSRYPLSRLLISALQQSRAGGHTEAPTYFSGIYDCKRAAGRPGMRVNAVTIGV